MADKRRSNVRGAAKVNVRVDWQYKVDEFTWIERLNFLRRHYGDRRMSEILGYSTKDRSYKSVRRLAAGQRSPNAERYQAINRLYSRLRPSALVDVAKEIQGKFAGKVEARFYSKMNLFLHQVRPYTFRREPAEGLDPDWDSGIRFESFPIYMRTCDAGGAVASEAKKALAIIVLHVHDTRLPTSETRTEIYLIIRQDAPSLSLLKNAIDSWMQTLPKNRAYISLSVTGVWFSYTSASLPFTVKEKGAYAIPVFETKKGGKKRRK